MPEQTDRQGGVLRDRCFLAFWASETTSLLGMEFTRLILPLVAILTLRATSFQVGLVQAFLYAPVILFSLFVGVWLDRRRRRSILYVSNALRAVLIVVIPAAHLTSMLSLPVLYATVFLVGTLTLIFEVGSLSYLPSLVAPNHLAEANGRIQTSFSLASIAGPSLGGVLAGVLTPPNALFISAAAFALSPALLLTIRKAESAPMTTTGRAAIFPAIKEGLHAVYADKMLRNLLSQSTLYNLFWNALNVVFVLYAVRSLGLAPAQLGFVLGAGAVASLLAAITSNRITKALGLGRTLRLATYGCCVPALLRLIPHHVSLPTVALLVLVQALVGFTVIVWNVNTLTLRQVVTPTQVLGRMNASYRMVLYGSAPVGALLGGTLGQVLGLREAMVITALLQLIPVTWTFFSPIFRLLHMPSGPTETMQPTAASGAAA